jgi:hypothetical protein
MRLFKRKSETNVKPHPDADIVEARAKLQEDKDKVQQVREHASTVADKVNKASYHTARNGFTELFKQGLKGA